MVEGFACRRIWAITSNSSLRAAASSPASGLRSGRSRLIWHGFFSFRFLGFRMAHLRDAVSMNVAILLDLFEQLVQRLTSAHSDSLGAPVCIEPQAGLVIHSGISRTVPSSDSPSITVDP